MTEKTKRILAALVIGITTLTILAATVGDTGLTWDEPAYIAAANSYAGWLGRLLHDPGEALSEEGIRQAWGVNHEHPPLDKAWTGVTWAAARNWMDDLSAHRLGNMLLGAALTSLVFLMVQETYGWAAGLGAAAALLSMPRFFFHAHLAALDVPAAFSVFLVTYVFWKTRERKHWAWGLAVGLAWGLALATKINAIFVPITLGAWWLIFRRDGRLLLRLVIMGGSGVAVFLASWPWLYNHTWERLVEYVRFVTVEHWEIGQYYLGSFHMPPPWHFGLVMTWAVVPLGLTILYLTWFVTQVRAIRDKGLGWLMFLSALTPVVAIAASRSIVYDNDRMYMASFPFLAGLAGAGLGWALAKWKGLAQRWEKKSITLAGSLLILALAYLPQSVSMARLYPHYLSYYSEGVGGLGGATHLGLETTYWCETYALAIPILNEQAEANDSIWVDPWSHDVLIYYQTQGWLRDDLVIVGPYDTPSILGGEAPGAVALPAGEADWYMRQMRQSTLGAFQEDNVLARMLRKRTIVYEYAFDGVPVFRLYRQPDE